MKIKTGMVAADGQEIVLTEYLCDCPGCVNVAEQVVGVALDVGIAFAVCRRHAAMPQERASKSEPD